MKDNPISVSVYGLSSSKDDVIRYIGQTSKGLSARLKGHITWTLHRPDGSRRCAWIASVLKAGYELRIVELEANAELHVAEMRWIAQYRAAGHELVNATYGGDQWIGVPKTDEHKAAIAAALTGRKSPWTSERNRKNKGKPGHPITEESKKKISAANSGRKKPWLAARNKGLEWNAERRAKIGDANRRLTFDQVREIKCLIAAGEVQADIARRFGISTTLVSMIKRGVRYANI